MAIKTMLIFTVLLLCSCASYVTETRQFGLLETVPEYGEITNIDTVRNEFGGVAKNVTFKRRK